MVIGLSGGIDSAITAAIAVEALGPENVMGVGMPGPYSSEGSLSDARDMAKAAAASASRRSRSSTPTRTVVRALAPLFEGLGPDVTEENIQARCRGVILMAISNKTGKLVLTTGNKSELAVGYCTLYGDMVGGLAVISDVPKTLVYELARWPTTAARSRGPSRSRCSPSRRRRSCGRTRRTPTRCRPTRSSTRSCASTRPVYIEERTYRCLRLPSELVARWLRETPRLAQEDLRSWSTA